MHYIYCFIFFAGYMHIPLARQLLNPNMKKLANFGLLLLVYRDTYRWLSS